jgi:hypothetical protein
MGNILLPSHFNNYEYKTSKEIRLDSKKYIFKTINLVKIIKLYVYMVFESLGFLWVPSLDIDESFRYYSKVIDDKLLWKIQANDAWSCMHHDF